jgi:excisionase family DNA binding protein
MTVSSRELKAADDHLLNAEEVAEMIGMTRDYVYDLSRRGRIPTITFGRRRRYRREAVDKWLEDLEDRTVR